MHDVHVFGDSHWRVFFPFVNHGSPGVTHEGEGTFGMRIRTIDMVANELSGATMYGLLNDSSKNGARRRILGDLDRIGKVENVGLVFGEVDARYHNGRYFVDGRISRGRIYDLLARYRRFIDEDLLFTGRTQRVFVYHGFKYPKGPETLLQPNQPIGDNHVAAAVVNAEINCKLDLVLGGPNIHVIKPEIHSGHVSDDGVHLKPEFIYPEIRDHIERVLTPPPKWEIPF